MGVPAVYVGSEAIVMWSHQMGIEIAPALLRKRENADLIVTLVFGDLHLDCIQGWRDKNMSSQYKLEYHCGEYHNIH